MFELSQFSALPAAPWGRWVKAKVNAPELLAQPSSAVPAAA
jgi:hypothetical protein